MACDSDVYVVKPEDRRQMDTRRHCAQCSKASVATYVGVSRQRVGSLFLLVSNSSSSTDVAASEVDSSMPSFVA
jgi:hypothetical protein